MKRSTFTLTAQISVLASRIPCPFHFLEGARTAGTADSRGWIDRLRLVHHWVLTLIAILVASSSPAQPPLPHILENDFLRIGFDDRGCVREIYNKASDTHCIHPDPLSSVVFGDDAPHPPFTVYAYPANGSIHFEDYEEEQFAGFSRALPELVGEKNGDLIRLRGSTEVSPIVERSAEENAQRITFRYRLKGGIGLAYTVRLPDMSRLSEWTVRIENALNDGAEDTLRVYRVAFPVLDRLCVGSRPERNYLARPFLQGELIPNPSRYTFRAGRGWPTFALTYPGWASMPWLDLYRSAPGVEGTASGLYLASYDPSFQQIDLVSFPDHARRALTLEIQTLSFLEPGQTWDSQRFMVGVHEGDWHWAADRYREDSRAWLKECRPPSWLKDCDGWFGTGGANYKFADLPEMYETAQWLGLNYLQIWSQMIRLHKDGKSGYYCFYLPDPESGGEEELARAVRQIRDSGGHVGFYVNTYTFDSELPAPMDKYRDAVPADVAVPDWEAEFKNYASVFSNGSVIEGKFMRGAPVDELYSGMCPAAAGWREYLRSWIVDKYVGQYGADAFYMDSLPVGMLGASRVCFSRDHGHETPHGSGTACVELARLVRQSAEPHVDLALATEFPNDAVMQYQTHALASEFAGFADLPHPEIYTYTFPKHLLFSGSCNGWSWVTRFYDELPNPTHMDAMDLVFLMGFRFDAINHPLDRESDYAKYLKRLIALRVQVKRDLYSSSFRDTEGLSELPPGVRARVFRGDDGRSATITMLDRRRERSGFPLRVDCAELGIEPLNEATLYALDDTRTELPLKRSEESAVELTVPPWKDAPAAIILHH